MYVPSQNYVKYLRVSPYIHLMYVITDRILILHVYRLISGSIRAFHEEPVVFRRHHLNFNDYISISSAYMLILIHMFRLLGVE